MTSLLVHGGVETGSATTALWSQTRRLDSLAYSPYEPERASFASVRVPVAAWRSSSQALPAGTAHTELSGRCVFVAFPTEDAILADLREWQDSSACREEDDATSSHDQAASTCAFVGQLSFDVTELQVAWLCTLLGASHVEGVERITKHRQTGRKQWKRLPTGGFHVLTDAASVARMAQLMHKRVLVDATGFWFAPSVVSKWHLDSHVAKLAESSDAKRRKLPYTSVVVQAAVSVHAPHNRSGEGSSIASVASAEDVASDISSS
jgi:adenosyl cobinamide kinase/adenosyl cobinamide phosphate guanylyltransferase